MFRVPPAGAPTRTFMRTAFSWRLFFLLWAEYIQTGRRRFRLGAWRPTASGNARAPDRPGG
jgi:hypothetical protein